MDHSGGQCWQAALERGAVDLAEAAMGHFHGFSAPSATPYMDMAWAADDWALGMAWAADDWARGLDGGRAVADLLAGARPVTKLDRLLAAGIDRAFLGQLLGAGDLFEARVDLSRDGRMFQVGGPDGRLLLAVRDDFGSLVDALALKLDAPAEWARLTGDADILGAWHLVQDRRELRVHATPLDWLRAGGDGICALDPVWGIRILQGLGERVTLRVPAGQGARLKAQLERGGLPLVAEDLPAGQRLSAAERLGRMGLGAIHG